MKSTEKKKITRLEWKRKQQDGLINRPDGSWIMASQGRDGSMAQNTDRRKK